VETKFKIVFMLFLSILIIPTFLFTAHAQVPIADIALTKTPSATLVLNGTSVSYLYNATNTGEVALTGAIYDDVYGLVGSFVNLQPSGWVGFNVTHTITANTTNIATAYGVDQYGQNVTATASAFVQVYNFNPTIESCESTGIKKDIFIIGDDVYANGTGYRPSTTYDIYLVEDITWVDGIAIPPRIMGTTSTITSDASGNVPPTLLWSDPLKAGKYDIVVDVNGDGLYYAESDALDDSDVQVTAGFFVIPELPLGTMLALATSILALAIYKKRKLHKE
jgi:hypothetical protein